MYINTKWPLIKYRYINSIMGLDVHKPNNNII